MQVIKTQINIFAMTNAPLNDREILFHILNSIDSYYKKILIVIYAHDSLISFEKF